MKHVAIGFVTGRKHFQNVLKSYINNWLEQGLIGDEKIMLNLFISYDLKYQATKISDYKNIPEELAKMVESINFYGSDKIAKEKEWLQENKILSHAETELVFGDGYARKRNIVMYFAIKSKMDNLVFLDDDEYPMSVVKNDAGKLSWMGQSVVGTHLNNIDNADITHGHHCGYISPIPYLRFNNILTENDFKGFIEAVSNDIITWEKIKEVVIGNKGVTFADMEIINNDHVTEVTEENGMKFISGGNLCINLKNAGKLPPFYNPPGARGEDTFMSTALSDLKVMKVPCYTFHDGFSMYNHMLNGVLPTVLTPVDYQLSATTRRFVNAAVGWIRYKPLLVYITQQDNYDKVMKDIEQKLIFVIPKLCQFFNTKDFNQILKEFYQYSKKVELHYKEFEATKKAWSKVIQSIGKSE